MGQIAPTLAITIAGIEIAGYWIGNNDYFWEERQLFLSKGAVRPIGEAGLWTYTPSSTILSAATYRLSLLEGWIEYACTLKTNQFGLPDTNVDLSTGQVDVLILGDSFLEGQGGCPWLTREELRPGDPTILNGGLQGASLQSMALLEAWLDAQIRIRNIALVIISNDFKRRLIPDIWRNRTDCLANGNCQTRLDLVWGVDRDVSRRGLLDVSRHVLEATTPNLAEQLHTTLRFHSQSYNLMLRYLALTGPHAQPAADPELEANVAAFEWLRSKYPSMTAVLVPQRDEVGLLGRENLDTARARHMLAESKVTHIVCPLGIHDYMPIDGHPNKQGYDKIRTCLFSMLGIQRPVAALDKPVQQTPPQGSD